MKKKKVTFSEFYAVLESAGWIYFDHGIAKHGKVAAYDFYKVEARKPGALPWDDLKARFTEAFGDRVSFGESRRQYAPEIRSAVVLLAKARTLAAL